MTKPKRIYLAGPEVFFPAEEHQAIVAEKKRLLREYGFDGVDPLDTELAFSDDEAKPDLGHRIYQAKCGAGIHRPLPSLQQNGNGAWACR